MTMRPKTLLGMLGVGLGLVGCIPMLGEDLTLDVDIIDIRDEALSSWRLQAIEGGLETWSRTFPGCPHSIGRIEQVNRDSQDAFVLDDSFVRSRKASAVYVHDVPNIVFGLEMFEYERADVVQANIIHELGHAHGLKHADSGLMRFDIMYDVLDGDTADIDDGMQLQVCQLDSNCCQ